ncbi:atherin [Nematolebias whitei]|uniref:atherin n=1 Tax=Nematolebias whitei TaxID=451745 RepID=UPI001899C7DC|nr:atherin [Nematolebias whitei]
MSEPNKYREWILETIDSLRSRKARPDLERICRMVRRRHGSDPDRTRTELEKLIQEQTVLKVSYKGSISYRNAAKVQRKSRKKSEFAAAGGADAPREGTEHPNNNGDSFTEQEEDSEPSPGLSAHTSACSPGERLKPKPACSPSSACLGCGATTSCAVGSGCVQEEKASARSDEGLGQQGEGGCPERGAHSTRAPSGAREQPDLSGAEKKTSSGSGSPPQPPAQMETVSVKPKLRVAGGGGRANSDLGDRLVASVRSLSERSLRGGASSSSSAASKGHMKPLGLKEILGSQEETLTRGKVKVVMEREVSRGRLRRTRCGNITLPLRGEAREETAPAPPCADRLADSALQDEAAGKPPSPPLGESEPMDAASEEEEEDDPRSSDQEGLPTVAMTTEPGHVEKTPEDAVILGSWKEEGPQQLVEDDEVAGSSETSVLDFLPESRSPPAEGAALSQLNGAHVDKKVTASDHLHLEALSPAQHDGTNHTSSSLNSLQCKTEVGVSSCMLTPTASPRDSGVFEEQGIDGSGGLLKSEGIRGSPVDWTVSDVVRYFTAAGFPEQATAFRLQEIDGKSLLLMQRNDVLTGLSIKLGPALKIYERHVKVLQKTHFEDDDC